MDETIRTICHLIYAIDPMESCIRCPDKGPGENSDFGNFAAARDHGQHEWDIDVRVYEVISETL